MIASATSPQLQAAFIEGFKSAFRNLGTGGKVAICILIGFFVLPGLLRVLSFFRRGGASSV